MDQPNLFSLAPNLTLGASGTGAQQIMTGDGLTWANKIDLGGRSYWIDPNQTTGGYDLYAQDWKPGEMRVEFGKDGSYLNSYGMQKDNWKEAVGMFALSAVGMAYFLPGATEAVGSSSAVGVSSNAAVSSPVYGGSAVGNALPPASAAGSASGVSWSTVGTGLSAAKTVGGFLGAKASADAASANLAARAPVAFAPTQSAPAVAGPQVVAVRAPQKSPDAQTAQQAPTVIAVREPQQSIVSEEKESMTPLILAIVGAFAAAQFFGG